MGTPVTFTFTILRAANVPLGLQVEGDAGDTFLTVRSVMVDGAVEAWNRQCYGETREVRPNDRMIKINKVEEADAMRNECAHKTLLKITIERDVPAVQCGGLRADADEFVPWK